MKAAKLENRHAFLTEMPIPKPEENEALIKISTAGICTTDIEILHGYAGFSGIAGHEFAGTVEKAPSFPELEGKRATADINCGCGKCKWCSSGDARHCRDRSVIGIRGRNGAFAEYLCVPVKNIHLIPESVEDYRAVFAEPLAAALEITQQVHIKNTHRIAVLGDGKMGLLTALALRHHCENLLLAGRHPEKLAVVSGKGIDTILLEPSDSTGAAGSRPDPFDIVVEATGSPEGIQDALAMVRAEGTVIAKTTSHRRSQIDLCEVVVNEIHILGSRCGDINLALRYLENGLVDVDLLVEKIYPFSDFTEAFDHACRKGSLKVLLDMNRP
ncbi:MAG: alcohol dehydrogenase catalytic domain-containing protein [Desulfobacteraceae bacterium]|nr:alcohol dehydrogenase catalytic domain-containing protein [Desulfobacteraceae bacterium]